MNPQAMSMELHRSWYSKIPSNCIGLKACNLWYKSLIVQAYDYWYNKVRGQFLIPHVFCITTGYLEHVKKYIIWIIFHFVL